MKRKFIFTHSNSSQLRVQLIPTQGPTHPNSGSNPSQLRVQPIPTQGPTHPNSGSNPSQLRVHTTTLMFQTNGFNLVTSVSLQHCIFPPPSQVSLVVPELPHPRPNWMVVVLLSDPLAAPAMEAHAVPVVVAPHHHHRFQSPWAPD